MKTIFIINPKAGQGRNLRPLIDSINKARNDTGADVEMYITTARGDAERFTRNYCADNGAARFIACGGDGTLGEVTNGAIESVDSQIGVLPIGTGNDFCRNFASEYNFSDIVGQIYGGTEKCDVIRYKTNLGTTERVGYCINMINIGFDCNVADMATDMKKKPFVSGPFAYFLSILVALIKKPCSDLKIEINGELRHSGRLLLSSVSNGSYCGGGIKSNPLALVNDGMIDINIIKDVSRKRFIYLLPYYMKGTHLNLKNIGKYILSEKCKSVTITPSGGRMRMCVEGEIIDAGRTEFEIIHKAVNFVLPSSKDNNSA